MEQLLEGILEGVQNAKVSLNFANSGLGVLVYILQAWALYTIAQRRGINKPWLAWIPVVNVWILGSISDQYQYVVKKQVKNKRKVLLGLNIAFNVIIIIFVIAVICLAVNGLLALDPPMDESITIAPTNGAEFFQDVILVLAIAGLVTLPLWVMLIIYTVFSYMALYDVFCSCEPKNSTLYLVLSLVGNVVVDGARCIFLMLCKDKDLGMPSRKTEVVTPPEIPEETPANTEE